MMDLDAILTTPSPSSSARVLSYNQEFLDSGCVGDFDEAEVLDDTVATYATNYVITAVCLLAVAKMMLQLRAASSSPLHTTTNNNNDNNSNTEKKKAQLVVLPNKYLIGYFFFTAMNFWIGGVYHQIVQSRDEPGYDSLRRASLFFYGVSNACLALSTLQMVTDSIFAWWTVLVISMAITVLNVIAIDTAAEYSGAIFNIIVLLPFAGILYARKACREEAKETRCSNTAKAVAMFIMILSFLVVVLLYPPCGSAEAYGNCFEDCPLPFDASKFNHNAVFHILLMIGLVIFAVAEIQNPTTPIMATRKERYDDDGKERRHDTCAESESPEDRPETTLHDDSNKSYHNQDEANSGGAEELKEVPEDTP